MPRLSIIAVLALLLAAFPGGCGGDDDGGGQASASETIDVSLTDFEITPATPRVAEPGRVEFIVKNDGETVHNLEVEHPGGETQLPVDLHPGDSGTLLVDLSEAGRYVWYCPVGRHRELGMEGEITVAEGGGTGTDTTEDSGPGSSY